MLLFIKKIYSITEYFIRTDKILKEARILHSKIQISNLKTRIIFYSSPENYPTRKAFRQVLPIITDLKKDWRQLKKLWSVFDLRYEEINKAHEYKNLFKYFMLINHEFINIGKRQKKLETIINLILYGEEKIKNQINNLQGIKQDLHSFDSETQRFARLVQTSKSPYNSYDTTINRNKVKVFEYLSERYSNKDFSACEDYFKDFNNFVIDIDDDVSIT